MYRVTNSEGLHVLLRMIVRYYKEDIIIYVQPTINWYRIIIVPFLQILLHLACIPNLSNVTLEDNFALVLRYL
jgi:hypothetical protein